MQPLVLLIDDDVLPMEFHVRALRSEGFEVEQRLDPDSALEFVREAHDRISAVILDIMMRPGESYKDVDTREGLMTGVALYRDLRELCPDVPVVVLTNVANEETLRRFEEGPKLKVVQKLHYTPFKLVDLIREMTEGGRS